RKMMESELRATHYKYYSMLPKLCIYSSALVFSILFYFNCDVDPSYFQRKSAISGYAGIADNYGEFSKPSRNAFP
ncbi:MAG: hypothetical protein WCF85_08680, partial [Rhodospirillaceae bacterium]